MTFGLILDGILMNVDPKGRNVAQFFKEEIAEVHGILFLVALNAFEMRRN